MKPYTVMDAHCDTMLKLNQGVPADFHFDEARNFGGFVQFFACYTAADAKPSPYLFAKQQIMKFIAAMNQRKDTEIAYNLEQIPKILARKKIAAVLTLENADCLENNPDYLYEFSQLGVNALSLTWNHRNALASGASCPEGGLTPFGKRVVEAAEEFGIFIDVSHLNQESFYDVLRLEKGKLFASHSSCAAIYNHPRNLTDQQILDLSHSGGVICACPYPPFITGTEHASLQQYIAHIAHIFRLTEGKGAAVGTDTDGIDCMTEGFRVTADFRLLYTGLKDYGFSHSEILHIFSFNLGRFIGINL